MKSDMKETQKVLAPKLTTPNHAMDDSVVLDACCEPDCRIPILVDKEDKESHRQNRCMACVMRAKLR
jgi:hypothetical protein